MIITVGTRDIEVEDYPEIEFYFYRSETTDKIVYQREGVVKIMPEKPEQMFDMPNRLEFLRIKRYTFIRCTVVAIDDWGITYRFENYRQVKQ